MLDKQFHHRLGDKFDFFIMNFRYFVANPINRVLIADGVKLFMLNTSLRRALGTMLKINNGEGQCSLCDLATNARLDRSHTTKVVIELERLGFARRFNKKNDKRVYVELLPEGREFVIQGDAMWDEVQTNYFGRCLSDEKLEELDEHLGKIIELLSELDPEKCDLSCVENFRK